MPHSNWKGVISFGLVSIPVVLYPTENKKADISFHQIDKRDNARIQYKRVNVNTGKEVPWDKITRGYEYDDETIIPLPEDILKRVAGENARTIDIKTFIDKNNLDIIAIINNYYLLPDKGGEKGYVILREALKHIHKIGIAKVIISTREYLAAILPHEDALILCLLKYQPEIRPLSEFDFPDKPLSAYKIHQKEIVMANKLIRSMSSAWKPEKYGDQYQKAIHTWVEESIRHLPHAKTKHTSRSKTNVINFVDLLKKSLHPKKSAKNDARYKQKHVKNR